MFLGSLLNIGLDIDFLKNELKKLGLKGYSIGKARDTRRGICGTRFIVDVTEKQKERYLKDIVLLINKSKLPKNIKEKAVGLFGLLGDAEAKVHGASLDTVHFHEVGAVDSIIDIVGSVIGIEKLGIDSIYASRVKIGTGMLGSMPLPAPASAELLKGIPVEGIERRVEMVTPTGAVFLKGLVKRFCPLPAMKIEKIGYGIGARDDKDMPNVLRVILGETEKKAGSIYVIETNIDDMNPQRYTILMEGLFKGGALDVFWTPVQMKKNRPGILATVLSSAEKLDNMLEILFRETTTFGIRYYIAERRILDRSIKKVNGKRIKIGRYNGRVYTVSPEYEDWKDFSRSFSRSNLENV